MRDLQPLKALRDTDGKLEEIHLDGSTFVTPDSGRRFFQGTEHRAYPWPMWHHLCSLDAPLVAVVWQWWLGRSSGASLSWKGEVVLALAVWLIYLADRWVDGRRNLEAGHETARHAFSSRYRRVMGGLIVGLLPVLTILTPVWLTPGEFLVGLSLLAISALYFWMTHGPREATWMLLFPKEAAVGTLFALGTAAFVILHCHHYQTRLRGEVTGFAILCSLNCALITRWERTQSDLRDRCSLLNSFPALVRRLPQVCGALASITLIWACLTADKFFLPIMASAALLGFLDYRRSAIHPDALRVLADLALLTPLIFLWF